MVLHPHCRARIKYLQNWHSGFIIAYTDQKDSDQISGLSSVRSGERVNCRKMCRQSAGHTGRNTSIPNLIAFHVAAFWEPLNTSSKPSDSQWTQSSVLLKACFL